MPVLTLMTWGAVVGCTSSARLALIFVSLVTLSTVAARMETCALEDTSPMVNGEKEVDALRLSARRVHASPRHASLRTLARFSFLAYSLFPSCKPNTRPCLRRRRREPSQSKSERRQR